MRPQHRGMVLMIVLGFLLLIAMLALSFVSLQSIERRVAANHLDMVRARAAAESGVQFATERLGYIAEEGWFQNGHRFDVTWRFLGSVANLADYHPTASSPDSSVRALLRTPLERSLRPSFAMGPDSLNPAPSSPPGGAPTALSVKIEGAERGLSGTVGGTYGVHGDIYALKVTDTQGRINVNEGIQYGLAHSSTQNLIRILNVLGSHVGVARLGDRLVYDAASGRSSRPAQGYRIKEEILRSLD